MSNTQEKILKFWFEETEPAQWFQVNHDFDAEITRRFSDIYEKAAHGHCDDWKDDACGCLALIIVLDQFPRNMFRGTPKAFATDGKALAIAKDALSRGFDRGLAPIRRRFLYLPFEHSEDPNDQRKSVELFAEMKDDDPLGYDYALRHLDVIESYGRFPHRNKILSRMNTPEEEEYLAQAGSGF